MGGRSASQSRSFCAADELSVHHLYPCLVPPTSLEAGLPGHSHPFYRERKPVWVSVAGQEQRPGTGSCFQLRQQQQEWAGRVGEGALGQALCGTRGLPAGEGVGGVQRSQSQASCREGVFSRAAVARSKCK